MAKRKNKHGKIKKMIRKIFSDTCMQKGINAWIGSRTFKDGIWCCTWGAQLEFPEGFDTTIRDTAVEEILPYVEAKYEEIIEILNRCFGDIQYSREENWYHFTYCLPPVHIAYPEQWEYIDGEFKKVKDARLLTEKELEDRLRFYEEQGKTNRLFAMDAKQLRWEKENWHKYFRFIGGSIYEDELFECTNYAGIRIGGEFSFEAFGEYIPFENKLDRIYIDMVSTRVLISLTNLSDRLIPIEQFKPRNNDGCPYLFLKDISDQLLKRYGKQLISIDVWTEEGLRGYIYRYDIDKKLWKEHGTTMGYA